MNPVAENRIGLVEVSWQFIMESPIESINLIFSEIIPIDVQWDSNGKGTYKCYSHLFEPIKHGDIIPKYYFEAEKQTVDIIE